MAKKIVNKVKESFKKIFNTDPLLVFSPGRINLIGEHTDYNDGFVFPAAINKGIALGVTKSQSEHSTIVALDKDERYGFDINQVKRLKNGGWRNYVLGVIAELQRKGAQLENINICFSGNIPGGAGMSSSAALENSVGCALNHLFKLGFSKIELTKISQLAEHNFAGVQCGIMDQYASMMGQKNSALLLDCRSLDHEVFKIDFKNYQIVLINTNVKHDLSESAYNDRRAVCETVSQRLGVNALREASIEQLRSLAEELTNEDFQKALYVIEENKRVHQFSEAIKRDDIEALGALLFASHQGLSNQYQVSCKELDFLIDFAHEHPAVLGGRMMGGGFGGCTINLVKKSHIKEFKKEVSKSFLHQFNKDCSIYKVKLSKGTHVI